LYNYLALKVNRPIGVTIIAILTIIIGIIAIFGGISLVAFGAFLSVTPIVLTNNNNGATTTEDSSSQLVAADFCIYNDTQRSEEGIRYLYFLFQEISETCIMYYVIIIDPQIGFSN
jgi:hypothetical protein